MAQKHDHKKIIDMYESGLSSLEISRELGIAKSSILLILRKNNVEMRPNTTLGKKYVQKRLSDEEKDRVSDMYSDGNSAQYISKLFGCSENAIFKLVRERGIEVKSQSRAIHSEEQMDAICHDYVHKGLTITTLASIYGGSQKTIFKVVSDHGIIWKDRIAKEQRKTRSDKASISENSVEDYINGVIVKDIANNEGICEATLGRCLRDRGVEKKDKIFHNGGRTSFPDFRFFDDIDTEEKAYILGFLYADGCNKRTTMVLSITDEVILREMAYHLGCEDHVEVVVPKNPKHKIQYRIAISSRYVCDRLTELGCHPAKSLTLKWPNFEIVPERLVHHFVRGYIDGDGCFSFGDKGKKFPRGNVSLLGTRDFLEGVNTVSPCKFNIYPIKNNKALVATMNLQSDYCEFGRWLYSDATIYMERKKKRFDTGVRNYDARKKIREDEFLTKDEIREIYLSKERTIDLADKYDVARTIITDIKMGHTYRKITSELDK